MAYAKGELRGKLRSLSEDDLPAVEQRPKDEKDKDTRLKGMESAVVSILKGVGEDPTREGLLKTPKRAAEAFNFFTKGYEESLEGSYEEFIIAAIVFETIQCSDGRISSIM